MAFAYFFCSRYTLARVSVIMPGVSIVFFPKFSHAELSLRIGLILGLASIKRSIMFSFWSNAETGISFSSSSGSGSVMFAGASETVSGSAFRSIGFSLESCNHSAKEWVSLWLNFSGLPIGSFCTSDAVTTASWISGCFSVAFSLTFSSGEISGSVTSAVSSTGATAVMGSVAGFSSIVAAKVDVVASGVASSIIFFMESSSLSALSVGATGYTTGVVSCCSVVVMASSRTVISAIACSVASSCFWSTLLKSSVVINSKRMVLSVV